MKETEIQKDILKKLREQNILCWRVNNMGVPDPRAKGGWRKQNGYNMPGMSDILCLYKGKFFAIEVKTPERVKNVSDNQKKFLNNIREAGGVGFVATSFDDVEKWFTSTFGTIIFKK